MFSRTHDDRGSETVGESPALSLTVKNILLNFVYYSVTVVILPWCLLSLETSLGFSHQPSLALHLCSIFVGLIGVSLQVWCIVLFQKVGAGTPSPLLPPKKLVTEGPYGWVRNPMNLGEVMLFFALAGWFASLALLAYALVAWLAFHLFIVYWEEPRQLERFGEEHERYKARVQTWIPVPRGV